MPIKLRGGQSVRRPVNELRVGADRYVRPRLLDVRWRFESRRGLCRGRLPRLPAGTDLRNTKRAGTEACPYDWLLEKQKAFAPSEGETSYGFPVRADTAVRPYAEDLSIRANSAIVRWRFKCRNGGVARACRFTNRVHDHPTQNVKSVIAGGRGSPPLHRIFWTITVQTSKIQICAPRSIHPALR